MDQPIFIQALHRPFNKPLKACRWVCDFVDNRKKTPSSSMLNIEFYLYLIPKLNKAFELHNIEEFNGIPSKDAVQQVSEGLEGLSKSEKIKLISKAVRNRSTSLDRNVYSTYKAASYFINFAKDKFRLISPTNKITKAGRELLAIRTGFFAYTNSERHFYFKRLIEVDFHLFISLCYFLKLSSIYDYKDYVGIQFEFLDKYYGITHFNFTQTSLDNYNSVRTHWVDILKVLDQRNNIRRKYLTVILSNPETRNLHEQLLTKIDQYENQVFRAHKVLFTNKQKFLKLYLECVKKGKSEQGFVNLYDIKSKMHIAHNNFEELINKFYEQEKGKKHIFFSNIVSSIDRRKRFSVRSIPVLKIKII